MLADFSQFDTESIIKLASGGCSVICVLGVMSTFYMINSLTKDAHPRRPALIQQFMWFSAAMATISGAATFYLGTHNAGKVAVAENKVATVQQETAQVKAELEKSAQQLIASTQPPPSSSGRGPASIPPVAAPTPASVRSHLDVVQKAIEQLKASSLKLAKEP